MIIQSAQLRQASVHEKFSYFSRTETLKVLSAPKRFAPPNLVSVSSAARTASKIDESIEDLKFRLLKRMLEILTGRKIDTVASIAPDAPQPVELPAVSVPAIQGGGEAARTPPAASVEYTVSEEHYEAERLTFASEGVVRTADGREIQVKVELSMSREFYSSSNLRFVDGQKVTDPLVVNFDGPAAMLTGEKFSFDLDADGRAEQISSLAATSGYLSLDRNGDGVVNDGSELFGPVSGNGFSDLALYDADKNGWIDEADPVFSRLRVWTGGGSGGQGTLVALLKVGVGAISLQNLRTQFDIKDTATNELYGAVRSSSIFLKENGGAGTVQQLDLAV